MQRLCYARFLPEQETLQISQLTLHTHQQQRVLHKLKLQMPQADLAQQQLLIINVNKGVIVKESVLSFQNRLPDYPHDFIKS